MEIIDTSADCKTAPTLNGHGVGLKKNNTIFKTLPDMYCIINMLVVYEMFLCTTIVMNTGRVVIESIRLDINPNISATIVIGTNKARTAAKIAIPKKYAKREKKNSKKV